VRRTTSTLYTATPRGILLKKAAASPQAPGPKASSATSGWTTWKRREKPSTRAVRRAVSPGLSSAGPTTLLRLSPSALRKAAASTARSTW